MKKFLLALAILSMASSAFSQTQPLTQPEVLGCTSPAPAVPPAPTVFISSCKTPAFLPTSTTSVLASVSKTSPVWAHTFSGYKTTDLIVACPAGATVSGASCTFNGADVSALVAVSNVPSFAVTPPPVVTTPTVQVTLNWLPPAYNADGTPIIDQITFNIYEDGKLIGTVPTGTTSFPLGDMASGSSHVLGVTAVDGTLESDPTSITYVVPPPAPKKPGSPTNVNATVK